MNRYHDLQARARATGLWGATDQLFDSVRHPSIKRTNVEELFYLFLPLPPLSLSLFVTLKKYQILGFAILWRFKAKAFHLRCIFICRRFCQISISNQKRRRERSLETSFSVETQDFFPSLETGGIHFGCMEHLFKDWGLHSPEVEFTIYTQPFRVPSRKNPPKELGMRSQGKT